MTFRIENTNDAVEGDKRFYYPVKVHSECPKCGVPVVNDGSKLYLSYPITNTVQRLGFYHECEDGDAEWSCNVVLRVTLEMHENQDPEIAGYDKKPIYVPHKEAQDG